MLLEATCVTIHTSMLELPLEYMEHTGRYMHLSRRMSCQLRSRLDTAESMCRQYMLTHVLLGPEEREMSMESAGVSGNNPSATNRPFALRVGSIGGLGEAQVRRPCPMPLTKALSRGQIVSVLPVADCPFVWP